MTTGTLHAELDPAKPKRTRKRSRVRSRVGAAAMVLCLLLGGCSVDDTDPTDVTEDEGVTGSTGLVEPDDSGSAPTTLGGGSSSTSSEADAGSTSTTSSG
jgi:hypothetical protein